MKIDKTVWKETFYVIAGTLGLSALMLVVYSFLYSFELEALYGALFGSIAAILNFFFMAYSLQKAVEVKQDDGDEEQLEKNQEKSKDKLKLSYAVRSLVYLGSLVVAAISGFFNVFTLLIPALFPQIVARVRMFWLYKHGEE